MAGTMPVRYSRQNTNVPVVFCRVVCTKAGISGRAVARVISGSSHAFSWQLQMALQLSAVGYHMNTPATRMM